MQEAARVIRARLTTSQPGLTAAQIEDLVQRGVRRLVQNEINAHLRASRGPAFTPVDTFVSLVPHVAYPVDPAVLRAIRTEFDPYVVPVWVTKVYRSGTGRLGTVGFHAIASARWNPSSRRPKWAERIIQPTTGKHVRITHMDIHLIHSQAGAAKERGYPGAPMPFDWRVYRWLRGQFQQWSDRERQLWLAEHSDEAKLACRMQKASEERAERIRRTAPEIKRRLESVTAGDLREWAAKLAPKERISVALGGK